MTQDTFGMEARGMLNTPGLLEKLVLRLMDPEQRSMLQGLHIEREEMSLRIIINIVMIFDGPDGFYKSYGGIEVSEFSPGYDVSTIIHRTLKRVEILIKEAGK
jgi:hypothetical protein